MVVISSLLQSDPHGASDSGDAHSDDANSGVDSAKKVVPHVKSTGIKRG